MTCATVTAARAANNTKDANILGLVSGKVCDHGYAAKVCQGCVGI